MFNLLPEEQKKFIYKEYRIRFASVALFLAAFLGVVFFIVLIPSFFAVNLKRASLINRQEKLREANPELLNIKELEAKIAEQKNKLGMASQENEKLTSEIIQLILENLVAGIRLESLSFEHKQDNIRINLKGNAKRRDQLVSFSKKIQEQGVFSEVNLPVSDLAKDQNSDFSISFVVVLKTNEKEPR